MAKYHGYKGFFSIDGKDMSTFLTDVSLDQSVDVAETSTFTDLDKTYVNGMRDATISVSGRWDDTATTGADAVLQGLRGGGSYAFVYGPSGNTGGMVKYTGTAILTAYAPTTPIADVVAFTATFQSTGAITRTTF